MTSPWIFLIAFVAILAGSAAGMMLRVRLPQEQLAEIRETVRLGAGLLTTLTTVVISLTIASAKSYYDSQDAHFRQLTAYVVKTDQLLGQYGPEAEGIRKVMREAVPAAIDRIWHEKAVANQDTAFTDQSLAEQLYAAIAPLSPKNDAQRSLKSRIEQTVAGMAQTRLLLFADGNTAVLTPFLLAVIFWLVVIFTSFGLFVEPGPIVFVALVVFALSIAVALFLVADLSQPFAGVMQVPREQLRNVLAPLS